MHRADVSALKGAWVDFSVDEVTTVWSDSTAVVPVDRLAEVVARYAGHPAIVESHHDRVSGVTYAEFYDLVRLVAGAVMARTESGDRVGILTEETVDHLSALFGVQRAGRTAVPLDVSSPSARLRHIVEHSGLTLILASSESVAEGLEVPRDSILRMGEIRAEKHGFEEEPLDPASPAQILYTSGSTGIPKGVVQSHAYLMSRFRSESAFYGLGPEDCLSQLFPISFAASNGHSYGALLNGATLFPFDIPTRGTHELAQWVADQHLTGLAMVPALFRRVFGEVQDALDLDSVRYVMVGGDSALSSDVEIFRRCFSDEAVFIHRLASTETGSIAFHVVRRGDEVSGSVLPAGRPAPDKTLTLVAEDGNDVSGGGVGELLVTGQLSEGYWNDEDLTSSVFQGGDGALKTYRTGDLARFDEHGNLIHLGRKDGRIKVRGFAVDVAEIERALLGMPGIEEGAIKAFEDDESGHEIFGYFVAPLPVDTQALRRQFLDQVPEYMVPKQLVQMDEMPLTVRGKIDRAQLERPAQTSPHEEPRDLNGLEHRIHDLWGEVLGRQAVPVDQSFFDLGGDSVAAYKLIGMIFNEIGVDLPASSLLSATTVREQARLIQQGLVDRSPVVVPIRSGSDHLPAIFGVHGRGGGIVYLDKLAEDLDPRFSLYGVQPETVAGVEPRQQSVEELAAQYLSEVRRVQAEPPYILVGSCFGGLVAWEMARLLDESGEDVAFLVLVDPPRPGTEHGEQPSKGWELFRRRARKHVRRAAARAKRRLQGADAPDYGPRYRALSRVHSVARRAYHPEPSNVPLTILAARRKVDDQRSIWDHVAKGGLTVEEYPVVHAETWTPWNRKVIARMVNERLEDRFPEEDGR